MPQKLTKKQLTRINEIKRIAKAKDYKYLTFTDTDKVIIETKSGKTYILSNDRPQDRKLMELF